MLQDNVYISTGVTKPDGQGAVGTRASAEGYDRVIRRCNS